MQREDKLWHFDRKLQVGAAVTLLIALTGFLWQTAAWTTETHDRLVALEKQVGKNSQTLDDVYTKVARIEAALPYMRGSLDRIRSSLDVEDRKRAERMR